jgi:uncharacterized phage-associated protein
MKALDVAKYIINANIHDIDNLKLQKLLYYCQGIHFCLSDTPLFDDEIEAWQYGPVVPCVYKKYKSYGFEPIHKISNTENIRLSNTEREAIDMTLSYYGLMSGVTLINKTHQETPWKSVFKPGKKHLIISKDSIKKYFQDNIKIENE